MTYAAIEKGEMMESRENLAVMSRCNGKLVFRTTISRRQFEERPKGTHKKIAPTKLSAKHDGPGNAISNGCRP